MTTCLDCGARIARPSRCAACQAGFDQRKQAKKNVEFGGSGGAWQRIRREVYEAQGGAEGPCGFCGASLGEVYEVDHRVELQDGGTSDKSNLMALHRPCHLQVTALRREKRKEAAGRLR